jgi:serine/threonine protein kinase
VNAPVSFDSDSQLPRWFGDYVLLKRLGRGGMGQVFLARSPGVAGIDRLCVIKTLRAQWTNDREYVARFVDEARVVVHLNHRNICPVFDVGQVNNTFYLAMDLVPGRDVQAIIDVCARHAITLPIDQTLLIIGEMLEALDAAHRLRDPDTDAPLHLVHRDVSPHNVLVSFDGEVKLIDFGLAHSTLKQEKTEPGVVLGKMAYMAPEHARGEPVDRRADLFAVGVMLYELAAGERYWQGLSVDHIWQVVGRGSHAPARLAQLPGDVQAIIARATAASPADRYATGAEMRAALTAVQLSRGIIASSADLRAQMEQLLDGESAADRRERAALMKLPSPHTVPASDPQSTRIARAPGAAATQEPAPVASSPRAWQSTLEIPQVNVAAAPAHTTAVRRDASSSFPPAPAPAPASWWRRGLAACAVAGAVVGAVVVLRTPEPPVTAPPTALTVPAPQAEPAALTAPTTSTAVEPAAPPVEPPVVPVVPPTPPVAEPTPPAAPPSSAGPRVSASKPVAAPVRTPPVPALAPKPASAVAEQPAPPPPQPQSSTKPWPATWPRLPEQKQALLRERCPYRPCSTSLLQKVPAQLLGPEMVKLQQDLVACLDACRAASR